MKKLAHLYFCFLGVVTGVAFTIHSALADDHEIEEVVVVGEIVGELGLLEPSDAASRLGLSLFETPATIEVLDSATMQLSLIHI